MGAHAIIQAAARQFDRKHAKGANNEIRLEFASGGAPWRQGCAEPLIKTVKKSLFFAVGKNLSILKLQTVLFEGANLINSGPIGTHPTHPDDGCFLSPNEMLLGKKGYGGIVIAEERKNLGKG